LLQHRHTHIDASDVLGVVCEQRKVKVGAATDVQQVANLPLGLYFNIKACSELMAE